MIKQNKYTIWLLFQRTPLFMTHSIGEQRERASRVFRFGAGDRPGRERIIKRKVVKPKITGGWLEFRLSVWVTALGEVGSHSTTHRVGSRPMLALHNRPPPLTGGGFGLP